LRIYIAGCYSADSAEEVHRNVARAMEVARQVYLAGHEPVVPHILHFLHLDWVTKGTWPPESFWVKCGANLLEHCDAILMLDGWQHSEGAKKEFAWAGKLNISTYFSVDDLPEEGG